VSWLRFAVAGILAACLGCGAKAAGPEAEPVMVSRVDAVFSPGDDGMLTVVLKVRNPESEIATVTSLEMDLWVNNHWFASASTIAASPRSVPAKGEAEVSFVLPLTFRREGGKSESSFMTLGLRGALALDRNGREQTHAFRGKQRSEVKNAPVFGAPER
jgi:hypothetical protein